MLHSVASDLGLHCLPMSHKKDARLKLVKLKSLTLCMLGNFACFYCYLLTFFQNRLFKKILLGMPSECKIVGYRSGPTSCQS